MRRICKNLLDQCFKFSFKIHWITSLFVGKNDLKFWKTGLFRANLALITSELHDNGWKKPFFDSFVLKQTIQFLKRRSPKWLKERKSVGVYKNRSGLLRNLRNLVCVIRLVNRGRSSRKILQGSWKFELAYNFSEHGCYWNQFESKIYFQYFIARLFLWNT